MKNFLQQIENHKYFKPVLTVLLSAVLPVFMMVYMCENVAYTAATGGLYNWWPIVIAVVLELVGMVWMARVTSVRYVMGGACWGMVLLFPLLLYICEEWMFFESFDALLRFIISGHYYMVIFMVALLTAVFWLLNVIWRRFWISATVMSVALMLMSYINLTKMGINGEPFLPTDFYFAKDMKDVVGFAAGSLPFTKELALGILLLAGAIVIMFFGQRKCTKHLWVRSLTGLFCISFVGVTVLIPQVKDAIFLTDNIEMRKQYVQKNVYKRHGFMGGFLINIEGYSKPPENYSKKTVTDIVGNGTQSSDNFVNPDVIVYLGESVFDVTQIDGITLTEDPLPNFHKIEKESLSGYMMQASGVGGGTVRSEFEVLTGINLIDMKEGLIPYNTYVSKSTKLVNGLPNYFRELGYSSVALHSYNKAFYSRDISYDRMGFEEFIGLEDMPDAIPGDSAKGYILDSYLLTEVKQALEKDDEKSKFLFVISMENHGPYPNKYEEYENIASCDAWTEQDSNIMNCYIKGLKASDAVLGDLYEYVMNRERPTVVLYFGDHLPALGDRHSVLQRAGFISTGWSSDWTKEDIYNMYRTPFMIFSNFKKDTSQVGDYSSYMLPSMLLEYMDAPQNGYWNLIGTLSENVRVHNRFLTLDTEGKFSSKEELSTEAQEQIEEHLLVSYDALIGKRYINDLLLPDLQVPVYQPTVSATE